jgi:hypothetical protein
MYLLGLVMLVFSFFLDWYSFKIYNLNDEILVSWQYNILFEWTSPYSSGDALNNAFRPENLSIPLIINLITIATVILSGYIVLIKDIEKISSTRNSSQFSYINGFLLLLILFYLIFFPVIYLLPKELYFPLIYVEEPEVGFIHIYSIGPGYLLHLIIFPLIFPYTIFFYRTMSDYEKLENTPEKIILNLIKETQEPLDLDKLIAQEELKSYSMTRNTEEDDSSVLNTFMEGTE